MRATETAGRPMTNRFMRLVSLGTLARYTGRESNPSNLDGRSLDITLIISRLTHNQVMAVTDRKSVMLRSTVETRLRIAIRNLIVDEYSLFVPWAGSARPASEVAACSQLARHLAPQFSRTWDVDCEYNREGINEVKRVNQAWRRPDLIVHRRTGCGQGGHNLLMIELKIINANERSGGTEESLSSLVEKHNYEHGVFLHLNSQPNNGNAIVNPQWKWFGTDSDPDFKPVFERPSAINVILDEARRQWAARRRLLEP